MEFMASALVAVARMGLRAAELRQRRSRVLGRIVDVVMGAKLVRERRLIFRQRAGPRHPIILEARRASSCPL
jgi:hypothetical protein